MKHTTLGHLDIFVIIQVYNSSDGLECEERIFFLEWRTLPLLLPRYHTVCNRLAAFKYISINLVEVGHNMVVIPLI